VHSILIVAAITSALFIAAPSSARTWRPPPDSERCASKWGVNDQRGSGNHMGRASVLVEPLKIQGGTGSTVAPIAVR
jgi:hypothetical protein